MAHRAQGAQPTSRKLQLSTGLNYHVLEWNADAPGDDTVLLVHGFLDNAWCWEPMIEAGFGDGLHMIAPDLRGHGDTDWIGPGGYYHFVDYLSDVHALVSELVRPRLSLVGHSMGGAVSAYYAGSFPARVHKLVMLEGLGPPELEQALPERVPRWLESWKQARERTPRSYASLDEAAERLRANDPLLSPAMARRLAEHGTAPALGGRLRFKHDPLHTTPGPYGFQLALAEQFWTRITCPTLLVAGEQSLFRQAPEEEQRRAACIARGVWAVLPGAGHMMQRHQPAALGRLIAGFLAGDPAA